MTEKTNYLANLPPWSAEHASRLAKDEGICIGDEHLQILGVAREFYAAYGFSASMRPLCKMVAATLGSEQGRSLYLNKLFPGSPAKIVAKLAGLPRPKNCI